MIRKIMIILFVLATATACNKKALDNGAAGTNGLDSGTIVPGTEADLVANVGNVVYFSFDSSTLDEESRATLDRQIAWLKSHPSVNITLEGNCDERGTRDYNLALGERRAETAKRYLVRSGIDASRICTVSYGKERPAVLGTGESVWRLNRRDVTVVTNN